jgi:hypothetical protein
LRNDEGLAEKVVFSGRSQINQPGKRWIGDRITFTVTDKKVLAEGNTRAIILSTPKKPGAAPASGSAVATTKPAQPQGGSMLAGRQENGNTSVASSKPGVPQ